MRGWRRGAECRTFFGVVGFAPEPNFEQTFSANPTYHPAAHHAPFSASAFCKVQLILRSGSGVEMRGAECSALFGVTCFRFLKIEKLLYPMSYLLKLW